MREALLAAYGKSVEELQQQFEDADVGKDETTPQFLARLKGHLEEWRKKDGIQDNGEGWRDLMLRTKFVRLCPEELVTKFKMDKVKTFEQMGEMATCYFEARGRKKKAIKNNSSPSQPPVPQQSAQASGVASRPWHSARYNNNSYDSHPRTGSYYPQYRGNNNNPSWRQPQRGNFERRPAANNQAPPACKGNQSR